MSRNKSPQKPSKLRKAPFIALSFFVILLLIGIAAEEPGRVLEQARQICLSCIGIG